MRRRIFLYGLVLAALAAPLAACSVGPMNPKAQSGQTANAATGSIAIGLKLIAEGLTAPVDLLPDPDGSGRMFVVDQIGLVRIINPDGTLAPQPFLDIRDRMVHLSGGYDERGLLGLAFDPNYARNGRFFVYYSAPPRSSAFNNTSHISEFQVSPTDPNLADPGSERIILQVDEPQANHNGGTLLFGPDDGYLYISLGDGGGGDDIGAGHVSDWYAVNEGGNGQDITHNLLGSILRIDVNSGDPYGIPLDNPFVGTAALPEIYAYGFRNPYRMSFDMGPGHRLFTVDAGQDLWEEIDIVTKGGNYGWNVKEGTHCFSTAHPDESLPQCPDRVTGGLDTGKPFTDPVIEFPNASQKGGLGLAVVAGNVYRGKALPQLQGQYIFGTWSMSFGEPSGRLFAARPVDHGLWPITELVTPKEAIGTGIGHFILGVSQDQSGGTYVLTSDSSGPQGNTGKVWKIVAR